MKRTQKSSRAAARRSTSCAALLCAFSVACGTTANRRVQPPASSPGDVASSSGSSDESGGSGELAKASQPARGASTDSVPASGGTGKPTTRTTPATTGAAGAAPIATISTSGPRQEGDATIATVAGHEILASELLELWLFRESPKVRAYLEEMVLSNLVLAEAHRLEMRLEVTRLDEALERALDAMREQIGKSTPDLDVDSFIRQRLGLDPTVYKERLRQETEIDLLAERCVRAWLLQSDRAEVSVIVVDDREAADAVQQKLEAGEDFAELAREFSVEESGKDGGRVPPIVRSDAALSRLAFTTEVGDVGGPVLEQGRYLFLKVDERKAPLAGEWSRLREPVEESLAERSIEDPEYWQWKMAMLDRYTVDMTPFLRLVGEPTGDDEVSPLGADPGGASGSDAPERP